ncbi:MAG: hypothetical protein ACREN5_01195, partial [Gemmatimonadales bacterium]
MITPGRVLLVLLVYAALFVVIWTRPSRIAPEERRTAWIVGGAWAVSVFIMNVLLYRAGVMSFLPWVNNFLHTFIWIGGCLSLLYFGARRNTPMWAQFVVFATFSLVVKVAERLLFGTWEHGHFFHVFRGNVAYVLGWSLADGLYPPITLYG